LLNFLRTRCYHLLVVTAMGEPVSLHELSIQTEQIQWSSFVPTHQSLQRQFIDLSDEREILETPDKTTF